MAIDTSIYGQLQPAPQINPLAQLGQIAQLQAAQYGLNKAQREDEQQNRLLSLVGSPEFAKLDPRGKAAALQSAGQFDAAGKVITSEAAANKDQREAEFKQFELGAKRLEVVGGAMSHLSQNPQDAPMVLQQLVQSQVIAPEYAQKIMQGASQAPDPRQFFTAGANAAVSAKDQMAQKLQAAQFGETQRHNMASEGNAAGNLAVAQTNAATSQGQLGVAQNRLALDQAAPKGVITDTADGTMLVDPRTGTAKPVTTASGEALGPKPSEAQKKELMSINQQNSIIQGALDAVDKTPDAFSFKRGVATNSGSIGESIAGRLETPEQTQARAYVFNNVSRIINERAGAAQSAQELTRLNGFLPAATDNATQIKNKLIGFQHYLRDLESGTKGEKPAAAEKKVVRTGTLPDGRRVVQYSDGSTDYAR